MGVRYFTIHAHFYQPPRQNPWLGTIEEEIPSSIYTSYNQLITDECYGKLAIQEIKFSTDLILNLYSLLNFNFGPTLLNYIEKNYPNLYLSIQEADVISRNIYGFGNAIAQVYNHTIMPLLPLKYKRLYVKWGIESFERAFKRKPYGMWLSECACDEETLEVLIDYDIKFTILSPHQIKTARNSKTQSYIEEITPGAYIWRSKINPSKKITLFVYDKELSLLSFKELNNTEKFYLRIKNSTLKNKTTLIATDGENYGHHIKLGDEYLKKLIQKIIDKKDFKLTNLTFLYHNIQPDNEAEINENTSWSCPHGIERWKTECSCSTSPQSKYKKWKETLFKSTQKIRDISYNYFISSTIKEIKNPKKMLERYITVYEEKNPHNTILFIDENLRRNEKPINKTDILKLLDMEIKSSFSQVSCGFFFDDITNIETINNIKNLIFVADRLNDSKYKNQADEEINLIMKEKSNYKIDFKKLVTEIKIESTKILEKLASEISYLSSLNFHFTFCFYDWKIKNKQKDENFFETSLTNINTFEQYIIETKIVNEKENLLFYTTNLTKKNDFIFSYDDFSKNTKKLAEILRSKKPEDINKKKFLYKLSNSTVNEDIINSYINLLKEKAAHSLPYAYEIAKFIINLSINSKLFYEIENEIKQTPLSPLLWKINLIKRRRNDYKKD